MSCNCGGNDYNISIGNNGNCEPSTPEYYISLGGVGVNGYSPVVNFVNQTEQSFSIEVDDINGIDVSDPVPKLSYVSDQINNINISLENKLNVDFSNSPSTISFPNKTQNIKANRLRLYTGDYYYSGMLLQLEQTSGQLGYYSGKHLFLGQDKIHYSVHITSDDNEIATIGDIPTNTSDLTNDSGFITSSDLPTVGNGTITLTQNGVTKGTFTTNQSGNTTIELDSGVTNPLTITDEVSNNFLQFVVNDSGSYIRTGTQGLALNGYLINTVDNPLSLNDVAFGLKAIGLKYDNNTIKVNQDGQLYADVQGGGGSYTAGTGIDITNDTISVDNTVAMKTDIPTNNNQLTNGAGYITLSALNGYATENYVDTGLAAKQNTLVSGTNIKTINDTSLLGSGNIAALVNTATKSTSLSIGDNASTLNYTTNVGIGSQATATASQAFGHFAIAGGQYSLALGQGAEASSNYAIQLGKGTNATATTLSVGFGNNGNYQLLNGTTGLIPDARISSNIARSSDVANTDLSNLSTTGQAVIDGKVSKSGDTMTGALNINVDTQNQLVLVNPYITKGTTPSERKYYGLYFNDSQNLSADNWKDTRIGGIETSVQTNGTVTTTVQAVQNVANNTATTAGLALNITSTGVASCSFPDTTCVDGQWQFINTVIMDNVSLTNANGTPLTYTLSNIPNDGHMYEVMLAGNVETGTTSGNVCLLQLRSDFSTGAVTRICSARTRSSSSMQAQGTVIIPLTSSRKIYVSRNSGWAGKASLWLGGYRRIGTNN